MKQQGLHKYRENDKLLFVVSDGESARTLDGAQWAKFVKKLAPGAVVVSSTANPTDAVLGDLVERGVQVYSAHWHATGIEKGLDPEEIATAFAKLPESVLQPVRVRPEISELVRLVALRNALLEYRKAAQLRISAVKRAYGPSAPAFIEEIEHLQWADARESETPLDREIVAKAKRIEDCCVLQKILGTKDGWLSAAKITAEVKDVSRFPSPASLWHFAGLHGPGVKRQRGKSMDWNPKLKVSLWQFVEAALKNNVPRVRTPYEAYRATEMDAHPSKCECETPVGHCGAMARRRVMKEILLKLWVALSPAASQSLGGGTHVEAAGR